MPLNTTDHRAVHAEHRRNRATAARASRLRVAGVRVLTATDELGTPYTLALSRTEPSRAYVLTPTDSGWKCDCFVGRWRGTCPHLEAVVASAETGREAA